MKSLKDLFTNEDYGDPLGYDITISRSGKTMADTKYSLIPSPPKPFTAQYEDKNINWNNWIESEDPLSPEPLYTLPTFK